VYVTPGRAPTSTFRAVAGGYELANERRRLERTAVAASATKLGRPLTKRERRTLRRMLVAELAARRAGGA
jgi:hypothetical protein